MMNQHEKWEYEKNLDEIVDRVSELIANILLMSVNQINDYLSLENRMNANQADDVDF